MNDAQTWTVIGLFFTILLAMMGLVLRVLRVEVRSLGEIMTAKFETIDARLTAIDRDVQRLYEHWMGEKP